MAAARTADLFVQPFMQGGRVAALAVFFGQKLQNLIVVGQATLVAAFEQACFDVM